MTFKPKILESSLNIFARSNPNFKIQNFVRKKIRSSDQPKIMHEKSKSQVIKLFYHQSLAFLLVKR